MQKPLQQSFNAAITQLRVLLEKVYIDHKGVVNAFIFFSLLSLFLLIRDLNSETLFSFSILFLFLLLSISLYFKEQNIIGTLITFSLGAFTAFTVSWTISIFSIFIIFFLLFLFLLVIMSSIKLAAKIETINVTAASFYIYEDYEKNKLAIASILKTVNNEKKTGLLSQLQIWSSVEFFCYKKIPPDAIVVLINQLNLFYTITHVDASLIRELLSKIYLLSKENDLLFSLHLNLFGKYLKEVRTSPRDFISILNSLIYLSIEKKKEFKVLLNRVKELLSKGCSNERIEKLIILEFQK